MKHARIETIVISKLAAVYAFAMNAFSGTPRAGPT